MASGESKIPRLAWNDDQAKYLLGDEVGGVAPFAGHYEFADGLADARGGFAVQVAARAQPNLRKAGLDPRSLEGRLIRVRGMIGGDGLMRVDHPEQIELLRER